LVTTVKAKQRAVHRTCEPSGGPVGAMIRQILSHRIVVPGQGSPGWGTMALLFAADRLDHLESEVLPRLREGTMVISDRYDLSSLAYQSATAPPGSAAETAAWIRELNRQARRPDLTIVLDVKPEVAAARRGQRGGTRELYEHLDLQARLAELYAKAEELVPGDRILHVDANQSVDVVLGIALAAIEKL
jgi:dTMP kinase